MHYIPIMPWKHWIPAVSFIATEVSLSILQYELQNKMIRCFVMGGYIRSQEKDYVKEEVTFLWDMCRVRKIITYVILSFRMISGALRSYDLFKCHRL